MKIGIIGSGYVGLVTGTCFAHVGHEVICVDNNPEKIKTLQKGKTPIYEPGLQELIRSTVKAKRLSFTTQIALAVKQSEVLFICVNTPPKDNGEADLSYVEAVSADIAKNLKQYRLIVEKSTVPVQTGEWIEKTIRERGAKPQLFDIASNPEFLREGSAVEDLLKPDRIVIGVSSKKAEQMLRKLYAPFKARMVVTDLKSSELIKHASNSFLATKISFINAVARVCDASGADVEKVAEGMGLDPRIGPSFLKAGIGFGGFCFPKDLAAFHRMAAKLGQPFPLLREALEINESQKDYYVKIIENELWNLKDKILAVYGISFKPDTDDIRFAPSINIIQKLQREGAIIRAYDPVAAKHAKPILKGVQFPKDPYQVAKNADALLFLTEWKEFFQFNFKRLKKLVKNPVVFDGRNMFKPDAIVKHGFKYFGIGRPPQTPS